MHSKNLKNCEGAIWFKYTLFKNMNIMIFEPTHIGKDMFPKTLVRNGDKINSALIGLGYLTRSKAVSIPGFWSFLKQNENI